MSETTIAPVLPVAPEAPAAAPVEPQQNEADLPAWAREAITKANREAAGYRTKVAELQPKADQFSALEEASKSEAQRLAEATAAAEKKATDAQAESARWKVAATHGIPAEHFDLLGYGTEEEIDARAVKIAAMLAAQAAPTTPPVGAPTTRPAAQLRPGATPAEAETEDDQIMAKLFGPGK